MELTLLVVAALFTTLSTYALPIPSSGHPWSASIYNWQQQLHALPSLTAGAVSYPQPVVISRPSPHSREELPPFPVPEDDLLRLHLTLPPTVGLKDASTSPCSSSAGTRIQRFLRFSIVSKPIRNLLITFTPQSHSSTTKRHTHEQHHFFNPTAHERAHYAPSSTEKALTVFFWAFLITNAAALGWAMRRSFTQKHKRAQGLDAFDGEAPKGSCQGCGIKLVVTDADAEPLEKIWKGIDT